MYFSAAPSSAQQLIAFGKIPSFLVPGSLRADWFWTVARTNQAHGSPGGGRKEQRPVRAGRTKQEQLIPMFVPLNYTFKWKSMLQRERAEPPVVGVIITLRLELK